MKLEELERGLAGATAQERFAGFMRHLSEPERTHALFDAYPVLLRIVVTTVEHAGDAGCEVIERLGCDWAALRQTLLADLGEEKLVAIEFGAGDRHRQGRSVAILRFDGGSKLVYKPRELSLDLAFERFLDWFASIGGERQRLPRLLPRNGYGWSEFVAATPCASPAEMGRFFRRQGELLAILHCLRAHDFHRENLIAAGEFPVLVDLETLCGPDYGRGRPETYPGRAGFELANSVTRVMLLPYLQEGVRYEVVEQSGLGGSDGQQSLLALPLWTNLGTDEMRLTRERRELPPSQNHPRIGESVVDARHFEDDVVLGFRKGYRLILDHRETLLGEDSPLAVLAGTEARVIFRDTAIYSLILGETFHPDLLRNALDRDRIFDRAWFGMDTDPVLDALKPLLPYEVADFWNGDVPHFTCRTDSRDVVTSQGQVPARPPLFLRHRDDPPHDRGDGGERPRKAGDVRPRLVRGADHGLPVGARVADPPRRRPAGRPGGAPRRRRRRPPADRGAGLLAGPQRLLDRPPSALPGVAAPRPGTRPLQRPPRHRHHPGPRGEAPRL